jgi:hypothetical protein
MSTSAGRGVTRYRRTHVGKWGRRYGARLEVGGSGYQDDANKLINRFVGLVESLPRGPRKLWDGARSKEFNVGIEAANESPVFEWRVQPKTVEGVMRVNGSIVVTVYAPVRIPYLPPKKSVVRRSRRK